MGFKMKPQCTVEKYAETFNIQIKIHSHSYCNSFKS